MTARATSDLPAVPGLAAVPDRFPQRPVVDHLVRSGAFAVDTPGALYRIRAEQHVDAAVLECLPQRRARTRGWQAVGTTS